VNRLQLPGSLESCGEPSAASATEAYLAAARRLDLGSKQAVLSWSPAWARPRWRLALTLPDLRLPGQLGGGGGRKLVPGKPSLSLGVEQAFDLLQ
jgi:hypothetical protein